MKELVLSRHSWGTSGLDGEAEPGAAGPPYMEPTSCWRREWPSQHLVCHGNITWKLPLTRYWYTDTQYTWSVKDILHLVKVKRVWQTVCVCNCTCFKPHIITGIPFPFICWTEWKWILYARLSLFSQSWWRSEKMSITTFAGSMGPFCSV